MQVSVELGKTRTDFSSETVVAISYLPGLQKIPGQKDFRCNNPVSLEHLLSANHIHHPFYATDCVKLTNLVSLEGYCFKRMHHSSDKITPYVQKNFSASSPSHFLFSFCTRKYLGRLLTLSRIRVLHLSKGLTTS